MGLPLRLRGKLSNCAAVIQKGMLLGVVPKAHLSQAERRYFAPAPAEAEYLTLCGGEAVPFGAGQIFSCQELPELIFGVEFGDDLTAPLSPSIQMAQAGAVVLGCLAADHEQVGRDAYRRQTVTMQSARLLCGYLYSGTGEGESTSDLVFGAHQLIAENGSLLAERRFEGGLLLSEIDLQKLTHERRCTQALGETDEPSTPWGISTAMQ